MSQTNKDYRLLMLNETFETGPERMCVICRKRFPKRELTRYTLSPQGVLLQDERKNSPGRGWYLCSDTQCVQKFSKYKAIAHVKRG